MKKLICTILTAALLLSLLAGFCFAETGTVTDKGPDWSWKYEANIGGAAAGGMYFIIALRNSAWEEGDPTGTLPTSITAAKILYVDQFTTTAGGAYTYKGIDGTNGFVPRYYEGGRVFLSGGNLANPLELFDSVTGEQGLKSYGLMGDVLKNGKVNAADASEVFRKSLNKVQFTAEQSLFGDVNQDGRITAVDASMVLQRALNKRNENYELNN